MEQCWWLTGHFEHEQYYLRHPEVPDKALRQEQLREGAQRLFSKSALWPGQEEVQAEACDVSRALTQALPMLGPVCEHLAEPDIWDVTGANWGHGGHWLLLLSFSELQKDVNTEPRSSSGTQAETLQRFVDWRASAWSYNKKKDWKFYSA